MGNIPGIKQLKLVQLNKGNSLFKNGIKLLERVITNEKPDILCLSESNINRNDAQHINYFSEYYHELNLNSNQIGISRNSMMIKKGLEYLRRQELEDSNICDIVIEIKSKGNRPIIIVGSYREWQKLKISNQTHSNRVREQISRFKVTMNLWDTLSAENKDYGENLRNFVAAYNSKHI